MIITKLIGGLGNQMFQYAAARRLAYIHNIPLKLDVSELNRLKTRKYELNCFDIKAEVIRSINQSYLKNLIARLKDNKNIYFEKHFRFDKDVLALPGNVTLVGYFQSEKYFLDIEAIIRQDFTFKELPNNKTNVLLRKIKSSESVSIHFRRTDYINNKKFFLYHGICSLDYYLKAISLIAGKIKTPVFFIFSDDITWVKRNLKIKYPKLFVDSDLKDKDYEDLRLMSNCRHHIIANSSFSWWGAWLNENKNKIVISPESWFKDRSIDTRDLIPPSWIRI